MLPIDDRRSERFNPAIAGRPDLLGGRKSLTVYPGMTGMMENAFINVKGVHHTVTAEVEVADAKTSGVIIAQAGYFGGWTLYAKNGKVHHEYNWFALERTNIASSSALAPGKHTIVYEFIPDSAKPGTGGKSILSIDGQKVAEGQIPKTQPFVFSADEGADVGLDGETNVSTDYKQGRQRLHRQDRQGDGGAEVARPSSAGSGISEERAGPALTAGRVDSPRVRCARLRSQVREPPVAPPPLDAREPAAERVRERDHDEPHDVDGRRGTSRSPAGSCPRSVGSPNRKPAWP